MFPRSFLLLVTVAMALVAWRVDAKEGGVRAAAAVDETHDHKTAVLRSLIKNKPRVPANRDLSSSILLDFEGIGNRAQVGGFYNGVGGPSYGVVFDAGAYAIVDSDAGGTGNIANEPSPNTALYFRSAPQTVMSYSAGFTGLSLYYTSTIGVTITLYDGTEGTGTPLAAATLPATGTCGDFGLPLCGDPFGAYGIWRPFTASFSGVAKSVRLSASDIYFLFDDVVITPASACSKTTYWLWNPTTNALVRELTNNTASCIPVPYNIEVRPCTPPTKLPVQIRLKNSADAVIKGQPEHYAPYFLWGDNTTTGDVFPSKKPLPPGTYSLQSTINGTVEKFTFTQIC